LKDLEYKVKLLQAKVDASSYTGEVVKNQDFLFHFAWQTEVEKAMRDPIKDLENDVGGLLSILQTCQSSRTGIKIIFPSTATIFGNPKSLPVNEDHSENPSTPYEINKLAAEQYLKLYSIKHGINFTCLRLANVFGEHQKIDNPRRGILNFFIGRALRGQDITVYDDGEPIRDYSYVQNFIDAFVLAAKSRATDGKMYVLGSGTGRSFNKVASTIQRLTREIYKQDISVEHVPTPENSSALNSRNFVADSSRFRADTGWFPQISFEAGLRRTMEFYKNE